MERPNVATPSSAAEEHVLSTFHFMLEKCFPCSLISISASELNDREMNHFLIFPHAPPRNPFDTPPPPGSLDNSEIKPALIEQVLNARPNVTRQIED